MELSMAVFRLYEGTIIVIKSVFSTSVGSALFLSTDSSTREYVPAGTPSGLIFTVAEVGELIIDTQNSSEPVFY
jgi:hypothetical protein